MLPAGGKSVLLINPPVVRPSEPSAGIPKLAAALKGHGVSCSVLDANLEGLLEVAGRPFEGTSDNWTRRSFRNLRENLSALKALRGYSNFDSYKKAVLELNRVIAVSAGERVSAGLANYVDPELSPARSSDLIRSAESPQYNPFFRYFSKRLTGLIEDKQPDVVGISLNYLSQALCTFAMAGFIRKKCPATPIVLGGGLVTSWIRRPGWNNPFTGLIDLLIAGSGEGPLLSFLGADPECKEAYTPDYGDLPLGDFLSPGLILPYSTSSGCYWRRCSFCPEKAEGNPYEPLGINRVINDIRALIHSHRPVLLHLLDSSVTVPVLERLAVDPPGIPWYGFARVSRHLADIDFCISLKKAGCVMLQIGLESGDQGVLDRMEKGIKIEIASSALKALKKAGIAAYVYLLFGTPHETEVEARKTLEFTISHSEEISFLNLALFNMPVGSSGDVELIKTDFYEGDLSLYTDFLHPKGWHRRQTREFLEKEFKRHRAISAILKKDPPVFTSNHAPFFVMENL